MKKYLYSCICMTLFAHGGEMKAFPSFQGFKGVGNTPNAEVLQEGETQLLYSNQIDPLTNSCPDFRQDKEQGNYFLNLGIFPNLDMNFRYTQATDLLTDREYLSDRSLNFKYKLPFIPNDIVSMALGVQDIGGGVPHFHSYYGVFSKELFGSVRTSLGYAKGDDYASLDGVFGSVEYQPFSWLQIGTEYDTREWNGVVKSEYTVDLSGQKFTLGGMAKTSLEYGDIALGVYATIPFDDRFLDMRDKNKPLNQLTKQLDGLYLNNISALVADDTLWFEYENTVYTWNDMDALGMVLGVLSQKTDASKIVVTIKKSNIPQYQVRVNTEEYRRFIQTGQRTPGLLTFHSLLDHTEGIAQVSDRFKPLITLQPSFILVDGSEYGHMDYTLSMQAEVSMRLAKGTIVSAQYNYPLTMTENFKYGGIFDYRNRNKTQADIDQLLVSQYFQTAIPLPWVNLFQAGLFDNELVGASWESGLTDISGKHLLLLKLAYLEDGLYKQMDKYSDTDKRTQMLLSYRYYWDDLNTDIKLTAGEFLYGDTGVSVSAKRYFSDMYMRFDVAHTNHILRGTNNTARLTLSIPFGPKKRFKTEYFDIQGGDIKYERRKTLVSDGEVPYAHPHHLKEIDNDFTLEEYYLDHGRFQPSYINENLHRLREVYKN